MGTFKRLIWNTFSEADNTYIDLVRVGYAVTLASALIYQGYSVFTGKDFSMMDFGTGVSLILFGGGAGIGIRAKWEDTTKGE